MANHLPRYLRKKSAQTAAARQSRLERRQLALSLRMAGASYAEIVKANIGYNSTSHVSQDMRKVLTEFTYETPEDVLVLDLARIDEIQKILTAALRTGDLSQAGPIMRCMQFRRETLGITPEVIGERRQNAQQVTNNGIMVVQGTTGDYIAAMAAASGADPREVRKELEQVSNSNKDREVIDAEIVEEPKKLRRIKRKPPANRSNASAAKLRAEQTPGGTRTPETAVEPGETLPDGLTSVLERFGKSADKHNAQDDRRENIPAVGLSEVLLDVDIPSDQESVTHRSKSSEVDRTLSVPIKDYDQNVQVTSGVSYKSPPRKMTPKESEKVVLRKLRKVKTSSEPGGKAPQESDHNIKGAGRKLDVIPAQTHTEMI